MTRSRATLASAICAAALGSPSLFLGCAAEEDTAIAVADSEIVNGTQSGSYPEIGSVSGADNCTGTLINQWWVLTASHCVKYGSYNPSGYSYSYGDANGNATGAAVKADKIVNLGNTCQYGSSACQNLANVTVSPDQKGNNDIALLHLVSAPPVTRSLGPIGNLVESGLSQSPAAGPPAGINVSTWGYGCGNFCASPKKYANWSYKLPDANGKIHHPFVVQQGDSGGPALYGRSIWGVNSITSGGTDPIEQYGSVTNYYTQMCRAMNNYPHRPCRTGAPLSSLASSCPPAATQSFGPWPRRNIVSHICEANYMNNPPLAAKCCTTGWDADCVALAQQYMTAADWNACIAQRVRGDWDGDGRADYALTTSAGTVHVKPASGAAEIVKYSPRQNSMPITADTNGDGKSDAAFLNSGDFQWQIDQTAGDRLIFTWGSSGDAPVVADFDGDGRDDLAVYRSSTGIWHIQPGDLSLPARSDVQWGASSDIPVPGDYDNDGHDDIAVWRPSDGNWYVVPSSTGWGTTWQQWGQNGDTPVPGDYDGDEIGRASCRERVLPTV